MGAHPAAEAFTPQGSLLKWDLEKTRQSEQEFGPHSKIFWFLAFRMTGWHFLLTLKQILFQFSSVAQLSPILCYPMDCSRPGLPVLHHLLELAQLVSIKSVKPSNPLIFCHPLLLLPSIFPSFRVFSSELVLRIRLPNYWSSISLPNEYSRLISFRID